MSAFQVPQVVCLPQEAISRARAFADAVIATVNYRDSNQTIKQKIHDDHFVSKLGEEAVRFVFEGRECVVKGPDYTVYTGKQKSWAADLTINALNVAVKNPTPFRRKTIRSFLDVSRFARTPRSDS